MLKVSRLLLAVLVHECCNLPDWPGISARDSAKLAFLVPPYELRPSEVNAHSYGAIGFLR